MSDWFVLRYSSPPGWLPATHAASCGRERYVPSTERHLRLRVGLDLFSPQVRRRAVRRHRRCWRVENLFPGYGFVRADHDWRAALGEPGVLGYVVDGEIPIAVRDHEIEKIRARVEISGYVSDDRPLDRFALAQRVRVGAGSMADVIGAYSGLLAGKPGRALVDYELLGRVVRSEVSEGELVAA